MSIDETVRIIPELNLSAAYYREAESVLLDRRYFALDAETFKEFTAMLDSPPATNPRLRRLLAEKAPWDR